MSTELEDLIERELLRRSLYRFVQAAWEIVEPSIPYVDNWHVEVVCQALEEVARGGQNLLINVPPGTAKSLLTSVFLPAWVWVRRPEWRAIFSSANPRVALRDSVRCRDLVESDWYRETFQVDWHMAADQNAKSLFKNSKGGWRLAVSVGSRITGDRADFIGVDDPHDAATVVSKAQRESVSFWWDQALANRANDLAQVGRVVIMQRLHEDDLSGHLIRQGGWKHLCLPMEYEGGGLPDPRTRTGDLLFPERFPEEVLEQERKRLGAAGYAGQMQQRPAPMAGNRFQRHWWRYWYTGHSGRPRSAWTGQARHLPNSREPERGFDEVIQTWDLSFKGGEATDYVCGLVIGTKGADRFVLDRYHARTGFLGAQSAIVEMRRKWPQASEILIEDKANGPAVIESLNSVLPGVIGVNPMGGKESRAAAMEPWIEAGNVYLPEGAPWLDEWVEEFAAFPRGAHDDQVDALSQGLIRLNDSDVQFARNMLGLR